MLCLKLGFDSTRFEIAAMQSLLVIELIDKTDFWARIE